MSTLPPFPRPPMPRWVRRRNQAEEPSILTAAGKATRGEILTPEEEALLGRRVPGGPQALLDTVPDRAGMVVTPLYPDTSPARPRRRPTPVVGPEITQELPVPDPAVDQAVAGNQGRVAWVSPQAAALMPEDERPDVRGLITTGKEPDMRDPHIDGVTFWLYRWWGRDARTGELYLLYVGETQQRPVDRLVEHLTSRTAPARFFKHLLHAWEVDPRVFPSKKAALAAEAAAIRNEYPARNTKGQLASNHRWTRRPRRDTPRLRPVLTPGLVVAWAFTILIAAGVTYLTAGGHRYVTTWWAHLILALLPLTLAASIVFGVRAGWRSTRSKPDHRPQPAPRGRRR